MSSLESTQPAAQPAPDFVGDGTLEEETLVSALRECYDPEIPVNIVDLGLVYGVEVKEHRVAITMTLTAMGCPFAPQVIAQVEERLLQVDGVEAAEVDIVYFPPWSPERMSEDARWQLGMV
ncbi:MAG: metal-sulfur cluster assembly factor [Candidatus Dormibacteria bacterium]